jgi:hypothetical protein
MNNKKFVVITSINAPTIAVREFAKWRGWTTIVVGDRKSPADWSCPGVVYLSLEDQCDLFPDFSSFLPENTYLRKMIGYLYAFKNGAEAIFESDDDNIPYSDAVAQIESDLLGVKNNSPVVDAESGWANIYSEFGAIDCWPRGFPLTHILSNKQLLLDGKSLEAPPWSVMQYLADEDPDVDAIYRMTHTHPTYFSRNKNFRLNINTFCPFNSQATLWLPDSFPLMFLPIGKTDRVTDILRGYMALASLWKGGSTLGYSSPIVYQVRNAHNLFKDFEQESDLYKYSDEWSVKFKGRGGVNFINAFRGIIELMVDDRQLPEINKHAYECFISKIN